MIIYKITNKVNGRVYIGQTVGSLAKRWNEHRTSKKNQPLYNAFRKYGVDNFTIETLCCVLDPADLNSVEQYFIELYQCKIPDGYNLTNGGNSKFFRSQDTIYKMRQAKLGHKVSEETRKKISESLMGRPGVRLGATHTESARAKISQVQLGRKASEETKKRMSEAHKARLAKDSTRSPAQIEALRLTHEKCKGRIPWNKGKKKS